MLVFRYSVTVTVTVTVAVIVSTHATAIQYVVLCLI